MQRRLGTVVIAGALTLGVSLGGCSGGDAEKKAGAPDFSRSEADSVVDVTARDLAYVGFPASVKGPEVLFQMKNDDPVTRHELQVLRTADAESMGGIPQVNPGQTGSVALTLPPGRYFARCMLRMVDTPHADLGMISDFEVE